MQRVVGPVALTLAAAAVAGCAAPVRVKFDEQQDFALYRTWAWAPRSSHHIDAPDLDASDFHARIATQIEEELRAQGLQRVHHQRADLLVAYRLVVQAQLVKIRRVRPAQTLTGSLGITYTAEPIETDIRSYELGHLVIGLAGPDGRLVWVGEVNRRFPKSFEPHLETAVASVLDRFPPPSPAGGKGPAHPPTLDREQPMLAAMFGTAGSGVDAPGAIEPQP